MTERPLPDVEDPVVAEYWQASRESRLVIPLCGNCGYSWWPPEAICPQCQTPAPGWREVTAHGTVWSYAVYHRALDPAFADEIPYAIGLIELDAGPKMYGRLRIPLEQIAIGDAVTGRFEPVNDAVTFLTWRRDADPSEPVDPSGP